ncbi:MAG: septum formation initiator family protein [Prevotellaceae bacterium]|jgi:cell division protein FtsB|nr:septum formation initiator family protein [Prevotellaceae bacterium]
MRTIKQKWDAIPVPRLLRNRYFIAFFLFAIWLLFDNLSWQDWFSARLNLNRLEEEKQRLEQDIQTTKQKIDAFANPDSLETIAREQFYFTAPGEVVYIIE